MKLHRLEVVVSEWGIGADMVSPVKWLERQIRGGKVRARKIGRHWYMTDDDIRDALDVFASGAVEKPAPVVEERPRGGLSAASMRRRIA